MNADVRMPSRKASMRESMSSTTPIPGLERSFLCAYRRRRFHCCRRSVPEEAAVVMWGDGGEGEPTGRPAFRRSRRLRRFFPPAAAREIAAVRFSSRSPAGVAVARLEIVPHHARNPVARSRQAGAERDRHQRTALSSSRPAVATGQPACRGIRQPHNAPGSPRTAHAGARAFPPRASPTPRPPRPTCRAPEPRHAAERRDGNKTCPQEQSEPSGSACSDASCSPNAAQGPSTEWFGSAPAAGPGRSEDRPDSGLSAGRRSGRPGTVSEAVRQPGVSRYRLTRRP